MITEVIFAKQKFPLSGTQTKVGDIAPDFTVIGNDLKPVSLRDFGNKIKIISVFPSIDTPVCATQNRTFNKRIAEIADAVVLSISVDLPFAQKRFCGAEGLNNIVTLSDHKDLDFGKKYGFLIEPFRLLARGIVVLDRDNRVTHVEYVPDVSQEPDYDKAFEAARKL